MRSKITFLLAYVLSAVCAEAQTVGFRQISYDDGLSNNTVNCIRKSSKGFLWVGTSLGLNRYDGFRIRSYFNDPENASSLPDNNVMEIQEDAQGMLWLNTPKGYTVFDPVTERFDHDILAWMDRHGMKGRPRNVCVDSRGNLWIATEEREVYHYDFARERAMPIEGQRRLPRGMVASLTAGGNTVVVTYDNGILAGIDTRGKRVAWVNDYIARHGGAKNTGYHTFVDSRGNYWVWWNETLMIYMAGKREWRRMGGRLVTDVAEDRAGNILIATDHDGLIKLDRNGNVARHLLHSPDDTNSLPDNTLSCVYVDNLGVVWVGTYRVGLVSYIDSTPRLSLMPWGDICTMLEGRDGTLWLGTNDVGIRRRDPASGRLTTIGKADSHLGSDIVVSGLLARDGTLWFGTYEGGLAHMSGKGFTVYRKSAGGLASDNVWALAQLPDGRVVVGTLGAGVQLLDPSTGRFVTFNTRNSGLKSDYVASVAVDAGGNVIIGHSQGVSCLDTKRMTVTDGFGGKASRAGVSASVNQVYRDSRGLIWVATISGLMVYDKGSLYVVNLQSGKHAYSEVCAVAEGRDGTIWVTAGNSVKSVKMKREKGRLEFFVNTYGKADGLQGRTLNKRSLLCLRDGRVLVGGIDGVNVIDPKHRARHADSARVVFSDLAVYDHVIKVGERFNKHVILEEAINESRHVSLGYDENTFTVQLSTDNVGMPARSRFMYRLKGHNDRWVMTMENQPSVQFTNLSPGHYCLEARVVDAYGEPMSEIASLDIIVRPPFYFSLWAVLAYMSLIVLGAWSLYRRAERRKQETRERMERQKRQEVEEMKMMFFINVSHELRTPLTLILAPLSSMIKEETDTRLRQKLEMMRRNALRLCDMVNQMLDLRRLMKSGVRLNARYGDVVAFVRDVCGQFIELSEKRVEFTFSSCAATLMMDFDADKLSKIVTNLLSNAFKFTPAGGRVSVSIDMPDDSVVEIRVADTGPGIGDEDKKHVFERFYQSPDNDNTGGSGIGLNIAYEFAKTHGGTIAVADNPGGGALFTVRLPAGHAETRGDRLTESIRGGEDSAQPAERERTERTGKREILVVDDNDDFLEFMVSELSADYDVATARDGQEALARIAERRPDLVLTDVMMPGMDGNELCRRLKGAKATADLPVVMLTARLAEENEIESRECGADDYIKKPFNMELLRMRVERLLRARDGHGGKITPKISEVEVTPVDEKFVADATAFVEERLSDTDLSVEQMSHELGMSRVKLYRRVLSVTGMTPSEFIRLIRLRHAEQLLVKSQLSISEIAYSTGFSSQRYFSKCFKELYGCIPSEYKNRKR